MNKILPVFLIFCLYSCAQRPNTYNTKSGISGSNYLTDIPAFTGDNLVNVVVEIPAGTNQKWEVNKRTGNIEWEQINSDSFRVGNYQKELT